jgi:cytochrome c-type biogenesis protein CcmE
MKSRHKKLLVIVLGVTGLGIAAALILNAFQSNLVFFFSPTQVERGRGARPTAPSASAAWWKAGSVKREADGLTVRVRASPTRLKSMNVRLQGHPSRPVQGRQGRGGGRQDRNATAPSTPPEVLAKHDENYMPPEAASRRWLPGPEDQPEDRRHRRARSQAMTPELGQLALLLALGVARGAGHAAAGGRLRWATGPSGWALARPAALGPVSAMVAFAFGCLDLPPSSADDFSVAVRGQRTRTRALASGLTSFAVRCGAATRARCCCGLLMLNRLDASRWPIVLAGSCRK